MCMYVYVYCHTFVNLSLKYIRYFIISWTKWLNSNTEFLYLAQLAKKIHFMTVKQYFDRFMAQQWEQFEADRNAH